MGKFASDVIFDTYHRCLTKLQSGDVVVFYHKGNDRPVSFTGYMTASEETAEVLIVSGAPDDEYLGRNKFIPLILLGSSSRLLYPIEEVGAVLTLDLIRAAQKLIPPERFQLFNSFKRLNSSILIKKIIKRRNQNVE